MPWHMTRRERDWGERGSKNKIEREKLVWKREEIRTHGKKGKDKKKRGGVSVFASGSSTLCIHRQKLFP